jgi:hypothetical protein
VNVRRRLRSAHTSALAEQQRHAVERNDDDHTDQGDRAVAEEALDRAHEAPLAVPTARVGGRGCYEQEEYENQQLPRSALPNLDVPGAIAIDRDRKDYRHDERGKEDAPIPSQRPFTIRWTRWPQHARMMAGLERGCR